MQGQLQKEYLTVAIETECKHCGQAMHISMDSNMHVSAGEAQSAPLVFMPDMDWGHFTERTIIDSY